MNVKVLEHTNNRITLLLENVPVVVANSIRRATISEVPTMAVEHVFIYKNTSVMDDEVLAHRLGLIPLKTNLTKYVPNDECDCKNELGCPKCSTTLYLEAKADSNLKVVFSRDIVSEDGETSPVSPDIPIIKLAPGQEISLEMRAIMGRGKYHAKWQPVSVAVVRGIPVFTVNRDKCNNCGVCVNSCPKGLIKVNEEPHITDLYKCTTCKMCERECPQEAIKVDINEDSSILTIESVGQLSPKEIIITAIDILIRKLVDFENVIKK